MNIRRVYYNNKSRQGWYIYAKEKGKRARILKHHPYIPESIYEYVAETNVHWTDLHKLNKVFSGIRTERKYPLSGKLKKGITEYTASLNELRTEAGLRKAYLTLIQPLLKSRDKNLHNIVVQNIEKLRNRFSYHVIGYTEGGREAIEVRDIGHRTPQEMVYFYTRTVGLVPSTIVSNQIDMKKEIAGKGNMHSDNVKVHETHKLLKRVMVRMRFAI